MSETQPQKINILIWAITLLLVVIVFYFSAPAIEVIREIEIVNGHAYLALGEFGIRVLNIDDPENPIEVGRFNTLGFAHSLASRGDQLFVADGNNGVLVLDISDPTQIALLWRYGAAGDARALTLQGDRAYIADAATGLHILNVEQIPPISEEPHFWIPGGSSLKDIESVGKHVVGITVDNHVQISDVSDPAKPIKSAKVPLGAAITDISTRGDTVFVATNGLGLFWFQNPSKDTTEPSGSVAMEGINIHAIKTIGNLAYLGIIGQGIEILDIADLGQVGYLKKFDKLTEITSLQYAGGIVYVGDGKRGLKTVNVADNYEISTIGEPNSQAGIYGSIEDIRQINNFLYMSSCQHGINILNLGENNQVLGQYHVSETSGCAGALDALNNNLIVAVKNKGVRVYDVSENPTSPKHVYEIPVDGAIKDVAVKNHFAYVANGSAGLTIVDWELPIEQVIGTLELGEAVDAGGIHLYGNYAYVASGDAGLKVVNIEDPRQPQLISTLDVSGYLRNVYVHPSVITNSEGQANLYAFGVGGSDKNPSGLWIIDVTNPQNPRQIGSYQTSEPVLDISVDGRAAYLLLEDHGLLTLDIGDPTVPQLRWSQGSEGDYSRVYRVGRRLYVAKKSQGVQLFHMENIEAPGLVFKFATGALMFQDIVVSDNYAYAVDSERGLWVIDISELKSPTISEFDSTPGTPRGLTLANGRLYLADGGKGFRIYSIENRSNPELIGNFEAMHFALAVAVRGEYAYVANAHSGLAIFNLKDPANIAHVASFQTRAPALDVAVYGNFAYVAEGVTGVEVIDVSNPHSPRIVTIESEFSFGNSVAVNVSSSQKRLYVADGELGLKVFNIGNPVKPDLIYTLPSSGRLVDVSISANNVYLADSGGGARVLVASADELYYEIDKLPHSAANVYGIDLAPGKPTETHLLVLGEQGGLGIHKITRNINFSQKGFAEIPGRSGFRELLPGTANPHRARQSRFMLYGGILGFILAANVMRVILSGIILPVGKRLISMDLFERLIFYTLGIHGEVVFAEGGEEINRGAFSGNGPGIVFVDGNSAVVLEKKAFMPGILGRIARGMKGEGPRKNLNMRTEGAGIVYSEAGQFDDQNEMFIGGGERVRSVVDLRKQIRFRLEVTAKTSDGIDVNNVVFALSSVSEPPDILMVTYLGDEKPENIRVIEKGWQYPENDGNNLYRVEIISQFGDYLDADDKREVHRFVDKYRRTGKAKPFDIEKPRNVWPPYSFDERRVFSAVASKPFDVMEEEIKHWAELPAHVAVGIYRDMLSKKNYDELYYPLKAHTYPLWPFKQELNRHLKMQGVLAFQFVFRKDGKSMAEDDAWKESELEKFPPQSFETQKLLRARGLKVIAGGFSELKPTLDEVQDQYMYEFLMTPLQHDVIITRADHELQAIRIKNKARAQTQKDLAFTFSKILSSREYSQEAMALRVLQALETLAADPDTHRLLPADVIKTIRSIRSLLLPGEEFIV